MRRIATLALTATLMVTGTSAALAQPGPPSDIPEPPAQAQGSPDTATEFSAEGRAEASERSGIDVPANDAAREDGEAFGQQRASDAGANAQGSPETGEQRSAEARENADPQGSPATGEERSAAAREDGRAFGEQQALDARARGEDEAGGGDETLDTLDDVNIDDVNIDDVNIDDVDIDDVDIDLDDVELPEEADQASGVLATISATLKSVLNVIKGLFGFGTDAV